MKEFVVPEGMPRSVFHDKYSRKTSTGFQSWKERVVEVARGNVALQAHYKGTEFNPAEADIYEQLMVSGVIPMSGRHLQQGDEDQVNKKGELFTNCSTAAFSFMKLYLLMRGSGVGRLYDEEVCLVDWNKAPMTYFLLSEDHQDYNNDIVKECPIITSETCDELRKSSRKNKFHYFYVPDSAEGWAASVSKIESMAFMGMWDHILVLDFSGVRCSGTPIKGQQGRPASGPIPLMQALTRVFEIAALYKSKWEQALRIDHALAQCVVMGGVRRSARIAVKSWDDEGIIDFINIKKNGELYTANNSVGLDETFWVGLEKGLPKQTEVFEAMCHAAYFHNSGEPGAVNFHRMHSNREGVTDLDVTYLSKWARRDLKFDDNINELVNKTLNKAASYRNMFITNPCGEIALAMYGGYCTIADVCLANAQSLEEVVLGIVQAGKALVRVNLMPFIYEGEVARTNRIGVGLTGIHEFAYKFFGYTWQQLHDETASSDFWEFLQHCRTTLRHELQTYCDELGVVFPHTFTTVKPSGTVSKVMHCSEGAHLPAYAQYLRWVQFPINDPAVNELRTAGYPVKDVSAKFVGHVVVGFPTETRCGNIMGDDMTVAGDATVSEQYNFIHNIEKYWLGPNTEGNQVSYTLKYSKDDVSFDEYKKIFREKQSKVRCCSVMPQFEIDESVYLYLPEEKISKESYEEMKRYINLLAMEAYDKEALMCEGGACPIEMDIN